MLKVSLPQSANEKIFSSSYGIPQPLSGTEVEVNGDLILRFEDEAEAVAYLDALEEYGSELDNDSPAKKIVNLIAGAVANDEFVRTYLQ